MKSDPETNTFNEFQTFRAVIHMQTPAIILGDLTLESLLAACVHQTTGKIRDEALEAVPLAFRKTPEGLIWQASAVMFDGRVKQSEHTVVRGRHFTEMGNNFYDPNPRSRIDGWAVAQQNGDYKRLMNPYATYEVSRLVWYATGDLLACRELLSTQAWIGKRRGSGFGQVSQVEVVPWVGNPVVDELGFVRRPIALRKLSFLEGAAPRERQRVISCVDNHPSWAHAPELCAVPQSRMEPRKSLPVTLDGDSEMFFFD
jgi:CRISPR type IV-associated protein Csf3